MDRNRFAQWPELITGILFALFGVISFILPLVALPMISVLYGLIALLSGIESFINWFTIERRAGYGFSISLIVGLLNTLVGIYLLFNAGLGRSTLPFIFPAWLIVSCVAKLASARQVRFFSGDAAWALTLAAAILGFATSVLLMFNEYLSSTILVYVLGGYLIIQGGSNIVSAVMRWRRGM